MTFPIKNFLLRGNRGFIYKREIKKRIKKLSDLTEEGKLKRRENHRWNENITAACLK